MQDIGCVLHRGLGGMCGRGVCMFELWSIRGGRITGWTIMGGCMAVLRTPDWPFMVWGVVKKGAASWIESIVCWAGVMALPLLGVGNGVACRSGQKVYIFHILEVSICIELRWWSILRIKDCLSQTCGWKREKHQSIRAIRHIPA